MKKISLLFVFVMLFVMLFAFNAFAATQKNVASEAQLTQTDSTSALVTQDALEKLRDGNYNTAATCGDAGKTWINYHFLYNEGTTVSKIFIVVNSSGENFYESKDADGNLQTGVYEDLTENDFNLYVRLYDAKNNVVWKKEAFSIKEAKAVEDGEGKTLYTAFTFNYDKPYTDIHKVEVAANSKVRVAYECVWEVEIYDYNCVDEEEHSWTDATCEAPAVCKYCKATTGTTNANNHTSIQADDGNCTTPVKCTACDTVVVPAYTHRFSIDASTCLNDGCKESMYEDNIANQATISVNPNEVWWACKTELLVDGNWSTATFAPMNKYYGISSYSYIFNYAEAQYLTRFVVAANGEKLNTPDGYKEAKTDAVKNVVIKLYNQVNGEKVLVYESERFNFTDDANEAILELPYALQVTEAEFAFNTSASWGSSFVREIEIYKPKSIETNIASVGNPVAGGEEVSETVAPEYINDGDKSTATHAPNGNNFTYTFDYGKTLLLSKFVVVANGECATFKPGAEGDQNNDAIRNVTISLYNKNGILVYETDRYEFTEGTTEIVIQLPYTYQASKVVATFNSVNADGNSFVREIEIYKTVLPNFPEGGVDLDEVDFDGCWKKIKLKDAIEEAIYYKPEEGNNRGGHYYAVDEDGNLILDENGNAIFLTGAPVGGNSNAYGSEMDGVKETGLGIFYEGQKNGIQYNFNKQYLIKDITITYRAYCLGSNDGYDLWVGKIVNGEEVWEQVASYTASEAGYSTVKFELGEDREGVEGSMFRFYWRASQTERLTPTLTEVDMTIYENRCDWTVNNVLSQVSCGYDAVAECECSRCGFEKTIVTAPATCEHNKVEITAAKAATCTDFGYNAVKQCTTCAKTFGGDRIAKSLGGHKQGTAATCTSKAICSVCNEEYGDVLAHTPDREASDCENDKICSVCKTVLEEKTGHNWVGPTCVAQKTCTNCGATEGEIGTHTEGTPATCTSKAICSVCNQEYGDFKHGELNNLKCSVCNKYVVTTLDELKSAMDKCSSTEKETIVLGADIKPGYGTNNFFEIVKPITLDFAGHTLEIGAYQNGIRLNHPECALISSGGTGTFNFVGNVAAVKLFNADTIQNININVKTITAGNPITGISIQLAKGATSAHVNSIKNVRIEGQGLTVGFETYQCGSNADLVINEMENVYINATYNGKTGKDFEIIGMTLQAPCGTFTNCTVTSAEEGVRFRASANWSMTGTFVNCQFTGSTHGLNMYSDGDISSTAVLAFKSDANTTFTCTSNPEKSFTAALNGAINNIEVEISGVKMVAYIDGQFYGSFEEAYAVVPDGGTLQILADVELVDSLVINKKITLDLNKYTVSAPNGKAGDGVFHVIAGGELTITGNGTVNGICANKDGYHMAIFVNGGKVVIEGGRFTNVGENLTDDQYDLIYVKGGELVINGGTFIAQTPKWTLNLHDKTPGSIVVNAGSFYAYDPSASASESPVANFVAEGKCVAPVNNEGYVVVANHDVVADKAVDATCTTTGLTAGSHCSVCGTVFVAQEIVDALDHNFVAGEMAENGDVVYSCSRECGVATYTINNSAINGEYYLGTDLVVFNNGVLSAMGGEFTYTYNVTTGMITTDDEGLFFQMIEGTIWYRGRQPLHTHAVENLIKEVTEPTCTAKGYTTYICRVCGPLYTGNEVAAKGHAYDDANDATCNNGCGHVRGVAYIGKTYYATFAEALEAAVEGNTIVLLAPVTVAENMTINKSNITITSTGDVFVVTSGTLTINGNITVNAGTSGVGSWCAIWANGGNVVINAGTYSVGGDSSSAEPNHQNDLIYTKNNGTVTINGGTFKYTEGVWTLNQNDTTGGAIVVSGGIFENFNPANAGTELDPTYSFLAPNACMVKVENNYVVVNAHTEETIPAVRPTPSNGNKAYTAGIKCADCNEIIQEVEEITVAQNQNTGFQIYNASLGLSDDITLIYLTYIPEEYRENAYMVFTYRGTEYVVDTKEEKDGIYRFRFSAVTPQYVGENIESVLYSKVNGEYVKTGTINYSVLAFCASWLNYDKTPVKTRTLMSDFLVYAAAAQVATNVNVDKLVTDGFGDKLTPSTFSKLDDSQFVMRLEGTADSRFAWKNVSLTLGSSVAMKFYFTATETENLKIKITINGRTQIIDFADCEYDTTYECYTASFTNITAIEFADEVKAEFMVGEEIVGNSALYTIDSFVYQWQSVTDSKYEKTINLVKALYNYGKSAWNSVH